MKRLFFIFTIIILVLFGWFAYQMLRPLKKSEIIRIVVSPTPTQMLQKPEPSVTLNNDHYSYAYFTVSTPSAITLLPNFSAKQDARSLADTNACTKAINGGFYDKSGRPLGFFYASDHTFCNQIESTLVNGFFWADTEGAAVISTELPHITLRFALQSGPLLLFDGRTMPLTIQNDEHARRMIVAKTTNNQFVFLTVYNGDSVFEGPMLADLPNILTLISTKEHLSITDALNLDGGSASAFYSADTKLSELTPVGSLFCIKL